jgi:hypothetical protein
MERPPQAIAASLALLLGTLWHVWRAWSAYDAPPEAGVETSDVLLPVIYAGWYLLLLVGFLRVQGWARVLFLYATPLLYGIDISVQLIEFDPLPADLLLSALVWILLTALLAPRRVAERFD